MAGEKPTISFCDLILALLYSVTLILTFAWIHNCQLPNVPLPLANIVGNFYSCVVAGAASAVFSAIFQTNISKLVLVWTVLLTCI